MRIGLEMNTLVLGGMGGIETYARQLVSCLQEVDSMNEYTIICSAGNREAFPVRAANFRQVVLGSETGKAVPGFFGKAMSAGFRRLDLARVTRGLDLVHYFMNFVPKLRPEALSAVTIVDIQHEYFPEFFGERELALRRKLFGHTVRAADHIMAISEFTRATLMEKLGVPGEKITAVHLGYDDGAFRPLERAAVEEFRRSRGLPQEFLLYPAATWPHKNHANLLRALSVMKGKHGFGGRLVLTGIKKGSHGELLELAGKLGLGDDVQYLGYLSYEELPLLYNAAALMVYPSVFEGFGIPLIEAFGSGLPVACSNTTSLPEVAGGAAALFDPNDPNDMASKIMSVLADRRLRDELAEKGLRRAKDFTWKRTAEKTRDVYWKILMGKARAQGE